MTDTRAGDEPLVASMQTNLGQPEYNRRLSDKLLAAFNHAYATGERDLAKSLRAMLKAVDARHRQAAGVARANSALGEADLWMVFVEARDRYRAVSGNEKHDLAAETKALDEMKTAYRHWSTS